MDCLKCKLCQELQNPTDRRPLNLPCGHVQCTQCLTELAKNGGKIVCPEDRLEHEVKVDQLGPNLGLLEVIDNLPIDFEEKMMNTKRKVCYCSIHSNKEIEQFNTRTQTVMCMKCAFSNVDERNYMIDFTSENLDRGFEKNIGNLKKLREDIDAQIDLFDKMTARNKVSSEEVDKINSEYTIFVKENFTDKYSDISFPINLKPKLEIKSSLIGLKEQEQILEWMQKSNIKLEKIHDTSKDGFTSSKFHSNCDNKGPTITITKTNNNEIIGGQNDHKWTNNNNDFSGNGNAFLFNLTRKSIHRFSNSMNASQPTAFYCHSSYGPTFGCGSFGVWDLNIANNCNSTNSSSILSQKYEQNGHSYLTSTQNFTVQNQEVFKVCS